MIREVAEAEVDGWREGERLVMRERMRALTFEALAQAEMAEVIRTVVSRVELEPVRPHREPVVMRGITLVPRHGTPVQIRR